MDLHMIVRHFLKSTNPRTSNASILENIARIHIVTLLLLLKRALLVFYSEERGSSFVPYLYTIFSLSLNGL